MVIRTAEFMVSSTAVEHCPPPTKPEFAFVGRSNVGKSSLLNVLTGRKNLAKVSSTPGKTQTINHFVINDAWYIADLPGYGFASASQSARYQWSQMLEQYLLRRENLYCTFILLDSRLDPQKSDLDFIQWLGGHKRPLALVFTKSDKLTRNELARALDKYEKTLLQTWEEIPSFFITSATTKLGREDMLDFMDDSMTHQTPLSSQKFD
jgi:GTP-binding protein